VRAFWKFTVLRLGLFAAVVVVLYAVQFRGLLLALLAAVISLALSYVLLRGPREELAQALADRAASRVLARRTLEARIAGDAAAEDAEVAGSGGTSGEDETPRGPRRES